MHRNAGDKATAGPQIPSRKGSLEPGAADEMVEPPPPAPQPLAPYPAPALLPLGLGVFLLDWFQASPRLGGGELKAMTLSKS